MGGLTIWWRGVRGWSSANSSIKRAQLCGGQLAAKAIIVVLLALIAAAAYGQSPANG